MGNLFDWKTEVGLLNVVVQVNWPASWVPSTRPVAAQHLLEINQASSFVGHWISPISPALTEFLPEQVTNAASLSDLIMQLSIVGSFGVDIEIRLKSICSNDSDRPGLKLMALVLTSFKVVKLTSTSTSKAHDVHFETWNVTPAGLM
jgi:hypothetical protein